MMGTSRDDYNTAPYFFFDTNQVISLRFRKDLRIKEVERLLCSEEPSTLKFTRNAGMSDHDLVAEQQQLLLHAARKTLALPVGRGCFMFGREYPPSAGIFSFPSLNLSCKLRPGKGITEFHSSNTSVEPDFPMWPEFHNGVAVALSIHSSKILGALDPSWIASQEPLEPTSGYAGMLLGLGLCGHLSRFEPLLLYRYLGANHQLTTIGTLLGAAMSHRGSRNVGLTKVVSLHISAMLSDISSELKTPPLVQAASLISLGVVHESSAQRRFSELFFDEMIKGTWKLAENGLSTSYAECYSLCTAIALGFINLGRGQSAPGLKNFHLAENLLKMINGVCPHPTDSSTTGALTTIAFMFLKSENLVIYNRLSLYDDEIRLNSIRPDLLMLRVLCRNLIMWNSICATEEWISHNLPKFLQLHLSTIEENYKGSTLLAYYFICTGACLSLGFRYCGTFNKICYYLLISYVDRFLSLSGKALKTSKYTLETCLVTCALSASLVMAGSGDIDLLKRLRRIRALLIYDKSSSLGYGAHLACHMALGFLFLGGSRMSLRNDTLDAIACLYCSVFPRFPNSTSDNRFHLQALRHFWVAAVDENRLVETRTHKNELISCPIKLEIFSPQGGVLETHEEDTFITPALLPRIEYPLAIHIQSPIFSPQKFSFDRMGDSSNDPSISHGPIRLVLKQASSLGMVHLSHETSLIPEYPMINLIHPILCQEQLSCWIESEIFSKTNSISPIISDSSWQVIITTLEAIDRSIHVLDEFLSNPTMLTKRTRLFHIKNLYHAARLHIYVTL